jgi:hypothetical protein
MLKKVLYLALVITGLVSASVAYAIRDYSINYEYYDDNGYTVGSGLIDCYGRFYLDGQKTNNALEVSREPCR